MISANELKNKEFSVVPSGYDAQEVNGIIENTIATIDAYESQSAELYHKLEVLAAKIEEYRSEENAIKTALVTAEKMAEKITKESAEKSEALIKDSEAKASATITAANEQADKIVKEAREYSTKLISEKTAEAENIINEAQTKANDAINSSKIVAQNILDQAKEISDDLISKSKSEKEAYEILISAIKGDAKAFIEKLKTLYAEQLDVLSNAKLETSSDDTKEADREVDKIHDDVNDLVEEIGEIASSIPEQVEIPQTDETPEFEEIIEEVISTPDEDIEETEDVENAEAVEDIEELVENFEIIDDEEAEEKIEEIAQELNIDDEPADPMEAVAAFSRREVEPIKEETFTIPEIDEEPQMEDSSLFDEEGKLPFESYFNVKTEDVHNDRSQTISLVPPEEDDNDSQSFRGLFKKKK